MRPTTVVTSLAASLLIGLGVAGCGGDQTAAVRAKVREFARAVRGHDYATICRDVLAPALLADMVRGGIGCQQAMAIALGHVTSPRLAIGSVVVRGGNASVLTLSQATGQKTVLTSLRLVQTKNGWRISSLGAPVG